MHTKARSKLAKLLEQLDPKDSFLDDELLRLPAAAGADADGASERDQGEEEEGLTEHSSETSSPAAAAKATRSHDINRYAILERRAMQLINENKALRAAHEQQARQAALETAELRSALRVALSDMEQRQRAIEEQAPAARARLEDYRDRLQDLRISEAHYQELLSMPREGMAVLDQIKVSEGCDRQQPTFSLTHDHPAPGCSVRAEPGPVPRGGAAATAPGQCS